MKRVIFILLIAALLCACVSTPREPIVEIDMRAQNTPTVTEAPDVIEMQTQAPTDAPQTAATEAPQVGATATYAQRVIDAWRDAGLLEGYAPYSANDLLDLYGIDLTACVSGAGFAEAEGYANEIVLVEADEATAGEVFTLLSDHLDLIKAQFRSYDAEAYALAERAVLLNENGVVLLLVSPDAETLLDVFRAVDR